MDDAPGTTLVCQAEDLSVEREATRRERMGIVLTVLPSSFRRHGGLLLALGGLALLTAVMSDVFLTKNNLFNVFQQSAVLAVLAAGATLVLISGGIDFSIGAMATVAGALAAQLASHGRPSWLMILIGVAAGTAFGAINGAIVAISRASPFVVTLGSASVLSGLTLVIIDGRTVSMASQLQWIGRGRPFGIPTLVIIASAVLVCMAVFLRLFVLGRRAYAIGGNEEASRLAGIPVVRSKILIYLISGCLAGLAGVLLAARGGAVSPSTGHGLELEAYAAVLIGGTSMHGGRGGILGTTIGVLLLGLLSNSINLLQITAFYHGVAVGGTIIIAVVLNSFRGRR